MVTKKRTTKLKMSEFDETFSEDHAEGTEVSTCFQIFEIYSYKHDLDGLI